MTIIKPLRDAVYDLVDGIDVSEVLPSGWEDKSKHPPKQITYPAFWVEPLSNTTTTLDSASNVSTFTFGISITESYEDSPIAEDTAIELADLVYRQVLQAIENGSPIQEVEGVLDVIPSGQWAFDQRYPARVYRIDVAIRVAENRYQDLDP